MNILRIPQSLVVAIADFRYNDSTPITLRFACISNGGDAYFDIACEHEFL